MLVLIFFCLPETLFVRKGKTLRTTRTTTPLSTETYVKRLALWSHHPELELKPNQFVLPAIKVRVRNHAPIPS
jgi:hypothetical protein